MFSKSCEYGLRAVVFIAQESLEGRKPGSVQVSNAIDSPEAFTGKILQILKKKKVIDSIKGPYGGFYMPEERIKSISISKIVTAIDGDSVYTSCGMGLKACDEKAPCYLHDYFATIRGDLKRMLEENTLYNMLHDEAGIKKNLSLKR